MLTKRLFVGIPLNLPDLVQQVESWRNDAPLNQNRLNWTKPENWHVTILFLGDTPVSEIALLQQLIDAAFENIEPFTVFLKGIGLFPNSHNPKVLWIGVDNLQSIFPARNRLGELLHLNDIEFDDKPLKPHLTLARIKRIEEHDVLHTFLQRNQHSNFGLMAVNRVTLFESILTPSGPVYKPLFEKLLK